MQSLKHTQNIRGIHAIPNNTKAAINLYCNEQISMWKIKKNTVHKV